MYTTNTIATQQYRDKYRLAQLDHALRNALVAEKICMVDRTADKYIYCPYQTAPTTVVQTIIGTYTPANSETVNETFTLTYEFIVSEQIKDFESSLSKFDVFAARTDDMTASVVTKVDQYVLNKMVAGAGTTLDTPGGGFSTPANVPVILGDVCGKLMGYADTYKGIYCVIENTDVSGFIQFQGASGFSYADAALNNGFMANAFGVEIYVARTGTFTTSTVGEAFTNSGHRLAGVKGVVTYAAPRGIQVEEKPVTGMTGKEVVVFGYAGAKVWTPKAALTIDITIK
jgi:hypothetical protein